MPYLLKPPLSDELRVRHVLDAINEIELYLHNVPKEEFLAKSEKRFATIKQLEIIGEACARISLTIKEAYPVYLNSAAKPVKIRRTREEITQLLRECVFSI